MTRRSYTHALDQVLAPEGFVRSGREWTRLRDGFCETVDLQTASYLGITANLLSRDLAADQIMMEALPDGGAGPFFYERIGEIIDGNDRWWRHAPNGPKELSEAVRDHGLPYFDRFQSLEERAKSSGRFSPKWGGGPASRLRCAVTLYRMNLREEACDLLCTPTPRRYSAKWLADIEGVRRRLGCNCPGSSA